MIKEKYISNIKETCITISNSKVESIRLKNDTKTSLRIYKDGYIGVAGRIGKYSEGELEKEALEALEQKIEYPCEPTQNKQEKLDKKAEIIKDEEAACEVEELLSELNKQQPEFIFSHKVRIKETNNKIVNDGNLDLEYSDRVMSIEIVYKDKSSSNIMDGFVGSEERKYDRELFLKESNMVLNAYKNKVDFDNSGTYPVIFIANEMPVEKFMSDLNGKIFASGSSLFSNKMGEKVFNENFTFYHSLNPDDVLNMPFFDAEGVVNPDYRYALIENGVISSPYTDKRTAKRFNLPLTGTSEAAYDGVPTLQPLGFKVKESDKSLKELLGGQTGIIVMIASGGDFTPGGDYGTPVQLAMLFDGENLIGRLPEIQISSNVFDMYGKAFRGVSKDSPLPYSRWNFAVMDMKVSKI